MKPPRIERILGKPPRAAPAGGSRGSPGLRRSRYLALLVALMAALLLAAVASGFLLYGSVRDEMDRQLGQRLLSIATTAAQAIGPDRFEQIVLLGPAAPEYERLRSELEGAARANDLDNIVLVDAEQRTLIDVGGALAFGTPNPVYELQPELRTTLLSGEPRATRLVEVEGLSGEFLKTGFAAIEDAQGNIVGAIAVEGGSGFFSVLPGMRRQLLGFALFVGAAVVILGIFIFGVLRSLVRYEDSMRRAGALAAIGQISAVVAHEIKNPLAIIRSRSERVRAKIESGKDPQEILEWFDAIPAEVDRLNAILTSYLSLARPDQEAEGSCRLAAVVDETTRLLAPELTKKGVRLERQIDESGMLSAAIGARSLKQVLLNLMLNSLQAMEDGGRLTIAARADGEGVLLEVSDSGKGMTPQERRRALEPFFTTQPTGSGLGLSLVQSLVQARRGTLEIRSTPGQGTRVLVHLPRGGGEE